MADYKRANYLRREIDLACRNAKGADTLGRYCEASWWEKRAAELYKELKKLEEEEQHDNDK